MYHHERPSGRSRCFAFLTFEDPASVNAVMVREHFLDGKIATIAASHRNDASSTEHGCEKVEGQVQGWGRGGLGGFWCFFRCVIIDSNYCILLTLFFFGLRFHTHASSIPWHLQEPRRVPAALRRTALTFFRVKAPLVKPGMSIRLFNFTEARMLINFFVLGKARQSPYWWLHVGFQQSERSYVVSKRMWRPTVFFRSFEINTSAL